MTETLGFVAMAVMASQLALGGIAHLSDPRSVGQSLSMHPWTSRRRLTPAAYGRVGAMLGGVEVAVAVSVAMSYLLFRDSPAVSLSALAGLLLGLLFSGWVSVLLLRGVAAPCGCDHRGAPANAGTLVRSVMVASGGTALMIVAWPDSHLDAIWSTGAVTAFVAMLAALALSVIAWSLPESQATPRADARGATREALANGATP